METTPVTEPTAGQALIGIVPLMLILLLVVIPYWKIWSRTGHSGWWGLLMLIPLANIISLWVLAFKDWPALRRP